LVMILSIGHKKIMMRTSSIGIGRFNKWQLI
jgi:hypothetical protein